MLDTTAASLVVLSAMLVSLSVSAQTVAPGSPTDTVAIVEASQPLQPESGPGGEQTRFPAAHRTHYGPDPGGYWIWEPSADASVATPAGENPLPVILYLSGCCDGEWPTPEEVDPWLTHLARQGYVVIAPVYNYATPLEDSKARLREALEELSTPGHLEIDTSMFAVIGFSFGGVQAVEYAAAAAAEGLPVPRALFLSAPCAANGFCLELPETPLSFPAGMKAAVIGFADDDRIGLGEPLRVFETLSSLPAEDRSFITMKTDLHGQPPILANHETTYIDVDAADWYGIWKLSDALVACVFTGEWCEYALGNTPQLRFMGTWSDGVPVTELQVTGELNEP